MIIIIVIIIIIIIIIIIGISIILVIIVIIIIITIQELVGRGLIFFLFSSTDQTVRLRFCSDNRREIVPSIGCRDSSLPRPWGPTQ